MRGRNSLIVGRAVLGPVRLAVVDPMHRIGAVQQIVGIGLIGRDHRARRNPAFGQRPDGGLGFVLDHSAQLATPAHAPEWIMGREGLAYHHTAARGIAMLGKASVDAVLGPVLGSHRPAHVAVVDLHLSRQWTTESSMSPPGAQDASPRDAKPLIQKPGRSRSSRRSPAGTACCARIWTSRPTRGNWQASLAL